MIDSKIGMILIGFLLVVSVSGHAQNNRHVSFDFPNNRVFEIRIDEGKIHTEKKINLSEGIHKIEIWVPGLVLITDTIEVRPSTENRFIYRNKTRPEYFGYARALKYYNFEKGLAISSITLSALSILGSTLTYFKANDLMAEYHAVKSEYASATDPFYFGTFEKKLSSIERQYNQVRGVYYSSLAFSVIVAPIISFMSIRHLKKSKRPSSKFMDSPFESKSVSMAFECSVNRMTLTLNL